MEREKLKFKIRLYSSYWDKPPIAEIQINKTNKIITDVNKKNLFDYESNKPILNTENSYFNEEITHTENEPITITFEHELEHDVSYDLVIKRSGKDKGQTVVNEKGDLLKDQILHIRDITIDEIDIGALVYEGKYRPEYPEPWASQQAKAGNKLPEIIKNSPDLGHNGTWTLTFNSPFYMWLLENLY